MKTLYLVRHAKSSWEVSGISDAERPLIPKGIKKTGKVIDFLNKRGTLAGLIISSPAVRALETAKLVAAGIGYPPERIRIEQGIYDSTVTRMLDLVYAVSNDIESLMIVGHNPTITEVANVFLRPGIEIMPTSAIVCLSFDTDAWEEIPGSAVVDEFFVYPKILR